MFYITGKDNVKADASIYHFDNNLVNNYNYWQQYLCKRDVAHIKLGHVVLHHPKTWSCATPGMLSVIG